MNTLVKAAMAGFLAATLPAIASAQACPSYANSGAPLNYTAESVWVPQATSVIAGGNLDLGACASLPGVGYVVQYPDFTMQYNDLGMGRALEIRAEGDCDTVLLVNAANGQWYFNDDTNGLNPAIRMAGAPSGQYDIWVGTLGQANCNARLIVESF